MDEIEKKVRRAVWQQFSCRFFIRFDGIDAASASGFFALWRSRGPIAGRVRNIGLARIFRGERLGGLH